MFAGTRPASDPPRNPRLKNWRSYMDKAELENRKGELRFLELKIRHLESQPVQKEIEELRTRRNKLFGETYTMAI
jgi:hypothetical protein